MKKSIVLRYAVLASLVLGVGPTASAAYTPSLAAAVASSGTVKATATQSTPKTDTTTTAKTDTKAAVSPTKAAEEEVARIAAKNKNVATEKAKAATKALPFSDIDGHWGQEAILYLHKEGVLNGYTDGTFRPNEAVTTNEFTNIFAKSLDIAKKRLAKADKKDSAKEKHMTATAASITNGLITDEKADGISRQKFAIAAARYADALGITNIHGKKAVAFKDADEFGAGGLKAATQLAQEGYISEGADVSFRPHDFITRAEAAAILYRIDTGKNINAKSATPAPTVTAVADTKDADTILRKEAAEEGINNDAVATSAEAQDTLVDAAFKELNRLYKTPGNMQNHGVMYWKDNVLHIALKSQDDLDKLNARIEKLAADGKPFLKNGVITEPTRYSQAEYDRITANFERYYAQRQPEGKVVSAYPDVAHNQLIVNIDKDFPYMNDSIKTAFGNKVRVFLLSPTTDTASAKAADKTGNSSTAETAPAKEDA